MILQNGGASFVEDGTIASLAQIILDPQCRTIAGFCIILEKDWLYYGYAVIPYPCVSISSDLHCL